MFEDYLSTEQQTRRTTLCIGSAIMLQYDRLQIVHSAQCSVSGPLRSQRALDFGCVLYYL
eukprot:scaffold233066_cov74-Cyclotella_meneghiniana.AAC.1